MPQKLYLDDNGEPIRQTAQLLPDGRETPAALEGRPRQKVYLDDNGEPIQPKGTQPSPEPPDFNDERSAGDVAYDAVGNVLKGIPQAITGIPGMLGAAYDATKQAVTGGGTGKAQQMLAGMVSPVTTSARGAAAYVAPDSVSTPTNTEWSDAQQAAGANLGGLAVGEGLRKYGPTPESLQTRAANNRAPLPPQRPGYRIGRNVVASGVGAAVGGPAGAAALPAALEGMDAVRRSNIYRGAKATAQERLSRVLALKDRAPQFRNDAAPPTSAPIQGPPVSPEVDPLLGKVKRLRGEDIPFDQQPLPEPSPLAGKAAAGPSAEIPFNGPMGGMPSPPPTAMELTGQNIHDAISPKGRADQTAVLRMTTPIDGKTPVLFEAAPELLTISKPHLLPEVFDSTLLKAFDRVESNVGAASQAVPNTVTVPKSFLMDRFKTMAEEATAKGDLNSVNAILKEESRWADTKDQIPWREFEARKRSFYDNHRTVSPAVRRVYGTLIDASNEFSGSEALKQANHDYSIVRRAVDAAHIDLKARRRFGPQQTPETMKAAKVKRLRGLP